MPYTTYANQKSIRMLKHTMESKAAFNGEG